MRVSGEPVYCRSRKGKNKQRTPPSLSTLPFNSGINKRQHNTAEANMGAIQKRQGGLQSKASSAARLQSASTAQDETRRLAF